MEELLKKQDINGRYMNSEQHQLTSHNVHYQIPDALLVLDSCVL